MARRFRKRSKPSGAGGFLLATLLVTCLFLCLNVPFVRYIHIVAVGHWSQLAYPKAMQLSMLIGPIAMLVAEWWVVDLFVSRFGRRE
jgi:hypothetical protein